VGLSAGGGGGRPGTDKGVSDRAPPSPLSEDITWVARMPFVSASNSSKES
jgi:hypothetical protein